MRFFSPFRSISPTMNALETPLEAAELQQLACDLQVDDRIVLRFKKEAAKKIVEWRGYVQVARGSGDNRHVGIMYGNILQTKI